MLMMLVQMMSQFPHLLQGESIRVQSEDSTTVHIIDVRPYGFQWNMSVAVVVNSLSNIIDIPVSISAIVKLNH